MSCPPGRGPDPVREQAPAPDIEELIGRRVSTRHRIDLAGRFVSAALNVRVQLEDISPTGACIRLLTDRTLGDGRLRWLDYEWFVRPVWQADLHCGLVFDERLDAGRLRRTLEFGEPGPERTKAARRRLASAWVHGPGDF